MVKVSVIIPTYNRAYCILNALESIFNQTFSDYEVIVVDDGSTDNTKQVLEKYSDKITYIYQQNKGQASARNNGIRNSKGEYIAFLDSDDEWLPERLKSGADILDSNKDVYLLFSDMYRTKKGSVLKDTYFGLYKPCRGFVFKELYFQDFIPTSSVIIRKECFLKQGYFDEFLPLCEDYDMWLRIAPFYKFEYIDKPLVIYRYNMHQSSSNIIEGLKNQIIVLENAKMNNSKLIQEFRKKANVRMASVSYLLCRYLVKDRRYKEAIKEIRSGIKFNYLNPKMYLLIIYSTIMGAIEIWR